jgi:hypothetical protein
MRGRVSGTCNSDRHLWEAYAADFPDAPRTSTRVATLVTTVAAWLATHHPPEETPGDGWGHWMVEAAGGDVVPVPTDHCRELRLALDGIVDRDQDLGRFLSQITPLRRDRALAESSGVRVMTMIGSKGLTVRATVLAGLDDGIVPRPDADLNEERRLLYVAMTRAKEYLFCTWAGRRSGPTARAGGQNGRRLPAAQSLLSRWASRIAGWADISQAMACWRGALTNARNQRGSRQRALSNGH